MFYFLNRILSGWTIKGPGVSLQLFSQDDTLAYGIQQSLDNAYLAGSHISKPRRHHPRKHSLRRRKLSTRSRK